MPIVFQVVIGSNLNTTFPVYLQITSNDNSSTIILIVTVVVAVLFVAVFLLTLIVLILRKYTQHRNRKVLNEIVAELEQRDLTDKLLNPSKSIQFLLEILCRPANDYVVECYSIDNEIDDLMKIIPSYLAVPIEELKVLDTSLGQGHKK